ncbi:serine hydrolase [Sphingomonas oligophenolica]|uniref:Beta-lactamase n=1 Tax=Sphingomonas oligophenolica TaxID=301154 RepID=A0ABU9Y8Y4_9SPHN
MKRWLPLLGIALLPSAASAQDARGDWAGTLEVNPTVKLRLALHIAVSDSGTLTGTFDSLDQQALGMPVANLVATSGRLSFDVPAVKGHYEATWNGATRAWSGSWSQSGKIWPLALSIGTKETLAPAPPRPLPAHWAIPDTAAIDSLIDQRIAGRSGAGIVIGVTDSAGHRVTGRVATRATAFDGNTLFEIGSMSKVFTALLLADMVERGEVALDDPAEKYLPAGAKMPMRGGRKITLEDLATHRSGLPRLPDNLSFRDPTNPYADYREADLLDFLGHYELTRDIGSTYEYSNLGFGLLGYLLARRAGTDYETLLKRRITIPLGMNDTTVTLTPAQKARFARGHDQYMRPTSAWDLPILVGAGGIRSTVNDLLLFLDAVMGTKRYSLAPAMKAMLAKRWPGVAPGITTGLGWVVLASPSGEIVYHDGGTGGFRSSMAYGPIKRRGVVVLSNAAVEESINDLSLHLLLGAPVAPPAPVPPVPKPVAARTAIELPVPELDRVIGRYRFNPQLELTVTREGAGLRAQVTGQPRFPIFAEAPLSFFWRVVDAQVVFVAGPNGRVTGAVLHQGGGELVGTRVAP